jgi:rhamnosyltransferase
MQNISSESLSEKKTRPTVEVLLATYNGEKYLNEFLTSLENQNGVEIDLVVSDDGSSDSTLEILNKFTGVFKSITILEGPRKGPAENFLWLLSNARGEYVALADQDDIWYSQKLVCGIEEMSFKEGALLHICSLNIPEGRILNNEPYPIPISLMRNRSQGCTMMFNNELLLIIQKLKLKNIVMHDWAILLVAQIAGRVIHSSKSQMIYRIHDSNFIGLVSLNDKILRYLKMLCVRRSNLNIYSQIIGIHEQLTIFGKNSIAVESFVQTVQRNFGQRCLYVIHERKIFFSTPGNFLSALKIIRGSYF